MATPLLRFPASRAGRQQYISELKSVYGAVWELPDPDYALANDPAIYNKIMRDPVIASAIFQRLHSVAGTDWHLEPAADRDEDKEAAQVVEDILRHISKFDQVRYELASAIIRGRSYGYVKGGRRRMKLAEGPMREWWVPQVIRDIDKRRLKWVPKREQSTDPRKGVNISQELQYYSLDQDDWISLSRSARDAMVIVTYQDREERLGYGEGLIVPIYHYFYAKGRIWQEYLQGIGRWAQGIVAMRLSQDRAGTTDRTNDDLIDDTLDALEKMRSQHALVYGEGDEVQVFEGGGSGHNIAQDALDMINKDLTRLIGGSVRPTGMDTDTGARAQAEVEQDTTDVLIRYDRRVLDDSLTEHLVRLVWNTNRENFTAQGLGDAGMPRFVTSTERNEDPTQVVAVISQALQAGVPLAKAEVYERLGFRQPADDEAVFKAPEQPEMGGPPGIGSPFTAEVAAQFAEWQEEKHARDKGKFAPKEGAGGVDTDASSRREVEGKITEADVNGVGERDTLVSSDRYFGSVDVGGLGWRDMERGDMRAMNRITDRREFSVKEFDPSDLIATQDIVHGDFARVHHGDGSDAIDLPAVYKFRGKHYIRDGHHRAAGNAVRGEFVKARLYDVDAALEAAKEPA